MDNNVQLPDEYDQIVRTFFDMTMSLINSHLHRIEISSPSEA